MGNFDFSKEQKLSQVVAVSILPFLNKVIINISILFIEFKYRN